MPFHRKFLTDEKGTPGCSRCPRTRGRYPQDRWLRGVDLDSPSSKSGSLAHGAQYGKRVPELCPQISTRRIRQVRQHLLLFVVRRGSVAVQVGGKTLNKGPNSGAGNLNRTECRFQWLHSPLERRDPRRARRTWRMARQPTRSSPSQNTPGAVNHHSAESWLTACSRQDRKSRSAPAP